VCFWVFAGNGLVAITAKAVCGWSWPPALLALCKGVLLVFHDITLWSNCGRTELDWRLVSQSSGNVACCCAASPWAVFARPNQGLFKDVCRRHKRKGCRRIVESCVEGSWCLHASVGCHSEGDKRVLGPFMKSKEQTLCNI